MLFIDYGFGAREFYHPQRSSGTLMCTTVTTHMTIRSFCPLADITAHVNFTAMPNTALMPDWSSLLHSQRSFLINCVLPSCCRKSPKICATTPLQRSCKNHQPAEMANYSR